jgi:hypothetical protein
MLTSLDIIQAKAGFVYDTVNEIKADQLELKNMISLIIDMVTKIQTNPPQAPAPRSRHFSDVFLKKLAAFISKNKDFYLKNINNLRKQ